MPLSYASNVESLKVQLKVARTTDKLSGVFERLSSGLRINSASDDPAGLSLAQKLRSDTVLASTALRNANDGLSVISVADAGLSEINNLLERMGELAQQSANGTYLHTQRSALSLEFLALGSEIERIARTTSFNSVSLLSGSPSLTLQVGFDATANSQITVQGVEATLASLGLAPSGSGSLTYSIIATTSAASQLAAQTALTAITSAIATLNLTRGTIGAAESRLTSAINYLQVARENFAAAESRITDADVAAEVAEMVRLQVLQEAGTAVLAQANLQPQRAYELLQ